MSAGTMVAVVLVYTVVPLIAIGASFKLQSRSAAIFFRWAGVYFLVVFAVNFGLETDCMSTDFQIVKCQTVPLSIARPVGALAIYSLLIYLFVMPVLSVIALVWEYRVRKNT